jgi:broad specificity phosphatase PhoE
MVADVLWARHGENVANLSKTLSYRVFDGDLTDVGRGQARELGERLAAADAGQVQLLACSPLRRARQTAEIVGRRLGLPVAMELDDLREVNVGDLDGRSDARAWEIYAAVLEAWRAGDTQARFPGGENRDELCARLRRALTAVARGAAAGRSPILAHGGEDGHPPTLAHGGEDGHSPILARSGEDGHSPILAHGGEDGRSLVVAHGANLRAALPCLAGEPDPGADLPTGAVAALHVHPGGSPVVRLVSWPGAAPG